MASSKYSDPQLSESRRSVVREGDIEDAFIEKLRGLKYTDRPDITDRASLEQNFRGKFEALNRVNLTDAEFARLLDEIITPDVFTAAKTLRQINAFTRDDGTPLNYTLVNIKDWCKNTFEVVNQLRINTDYSHHRYDVLLLINGVPCVQVELKTLGVSPRRAMEQIVEYKNDPGNGYTKTLLSFIQLFIVSNRDRTYYFANNNARHFAFNAGERFLPVYEFADEDNKKITHLDDFADRFLKKCDLGRTISRYMVLLAGEQKLMIMRPYQVYAVQHMVKCIDDDDGNGFVWHTTGSGKTLTSFKASTLLKENDHIHKCVFVVDRKDLDRQTREEFNKFQEGCVEENTNTAALVRRLLSEDYADKVIVTTIQKLGLALDESSKRNKQRKKNDQPTYKEMQAPLSDKRIVFIFDECHRSQFGENHKAIKEFFPKAQLSRPRARSRRKPCKKPWCTMSLAFPRGSSPRSISPPSRCKPDAPKTRPGCSSSLNPAPSMPRPSRTFSPGTRSPSGGRNSSDSSSPTLHELRSPGHPRKQAPLPPAPRRAPHRRKAPDARCPARARSHPPPRAFIRASRRADTLSRRKTPPMTDTNQKQLGNTSGASPTNCAERWIRTTSATTCCPSSSCASNRINFVASRK